MRTGVQEPEALGLQKLELYEDTGRSEGAEHRTRHGNVGRGWASESLADHGHEIEAGRPGRPDVPIPLAITCHWMISFFFFLP